MKNLLKFVAVSALVVVIGSSVAYAAMTATITSPTAGAVYNVGQTVNLGANSTDATGAVNYVWSFSDGTASITGQNQSVTFTTAGSKTITLLAGDASGVNDTKTVDVTVNDVTTALAISNVRVTDITTNSAIVRWTTNRISNSRVIFDTTSHASIAGATAPNYGYANSTGTSDVDTKVVEHAVTVTGLSANTQYYFRVISAE